MKKKIQVIKNNIKPVAKKRINRFKYKSLKLKTPQKHTNLITILKKGLKKKKRKVRLAGRNFYVIAFRKLLAYQRQYSFKRIRYCSFNNFKFKNHKNFYIFVKRRKYTNTILKRSFFKKFIRLGFFKRFLQRGRKLKAILKIKRRKVKAGFLFIKIRKLISVLRLLLVNNTKLAEFYNNKYFSKFFFSIQVKKILLRYKKLMFKMMRRKYRRKYRRLNRFYKLRKLKVRRLSRYNIVVKKSYNNFFLTAFSKFDGVVFEKITGSFSELKGAKRATTTSLERISKIFIKDLILKNVLKKKFDFIIQTPYVSRGVKNAIRNITTARKRVFVRSKRKAFYRRLKIRNIILNFKASHNGYTQM